jgi:hypothetical protein
MEQQHSKNMLLHHPGLLHHPAAALLLDGT